jgi:hypothetical protein
VSDEPTYVDIDDEGKPLGKDRRPKWQIPETDFQLRIVSICKRKYFSNRHEKGELNLIDHSMFPWKPGQTIPTYPTEFVEEILTWAGKKNTQANYPVVNVSSIIKAIKNPINLERYIDKATRGTQTEEKDYGSTPYGNY